MPHPVGRWQRSVGLAVAVGVLAGLATLALHTALHHGAALLVGRFADLGGPEVWHFRIQVLFFPAIGGLASGVVVQLIARLPPGHGTNQVVRAFHHQDGVMSLPNPAVKATAAVGVISCGGSAGPEGPAAALGAAIGSSLGRLFRVTPRDRRALLLAGCAAGIGAIFNCPLGGALFAVSILYRGPEFEGSALVSAFVASAVGYATYMSFEGFGQHMLAGASELHFASAAELPVFVALGLACGATSILYSVSVRRVEGVFARARRMPIWLRPALGGLLTGGLACMLPQVMDGQYAMIQNALDGSLFHDPSRSWAVWAVLLALIVVAKCLATAFTVGSGGAGGVLGPSLFIGGAVGACLGALLETLWPGQGPELMRRELIPVGMAGVLSATMRTPLAAIVMVMEMTGSFGLIVPLMVVTITAYVVGSRFGLIEEQLGSAADSPAHAGDAVVNVLERLPVGAVMQGIWPAVANRSTPLARLVASLPVGEVPTVAVVEGPELVGLISFAELRHLVDRSELPSVVIADDLMTRDFEVLEPELSLYEALDLFERTGMEAIPVVESRAERHFLGMLTRAGVRHVVFEHVRRMRDRLLQEHAGLAAIDEQTQLVHLLSGMPSTQAGEVYRVPVDEELDGRSLRELDFRARRGGVVLAIQTQEHHLISPPDPGRPLAKGEFLLVLGATPPPPPRDA